MGLVLGKQGHSLGGVERKPSSCKLHGFHKWRGCEACRPKHLEHLKHLQSGTRLQLFSCCRLLLCKSIPGPGSLSLTGYAPCLPLSARAGRHPLAEMVVESYIPFSTHMQEDRGRLQVVSGACARCP